VSGIFPARRVGRQVPASRNALIAALCCCLVVLQSCALSTNAADSRVKRIAFLRSVSTPGSVTDQAFIDELATHGFFEDRNLVIVGGKGDEVFPDPDSARAAVNRWQQEGIDLIVAYSTSGAEIARDNAPDAHVLFLVNDPVAAGFVRDENRPDGNMTGVTFRIPADRMLSLVNRIMPGVKRIGLPYPPADPAAIPSRDQFAQAARAQDLQLLAEPFSDEPDLNRAVDALVVSAGAEVLLASVSPTATRALPQLAEAAGRHRVPFVANVGSAERALLTLSPDGQGIGEQLGRQAARLLNGAKAESVPVEDPRRFQLTLNESVAAELGIALPADVVREAHVVRR